MVTRTVDEHLYWGAVYVAWIGDDANWEITRTKVLKDIPALVLTLLAPSIRTSILANMVGHGIGRHSEAGACARAVRAAAAVLPPPTAVSPLRFHVQT